MGAYMWGPAVLRGNPVPENSGGEKAGVNPSQIGTLLTTYVSRRAFSGAPCTEGGGNRNP